MAILRRKNAKLVLCEVHMVVNLPALFAILVYKLDHGRFYTKLCAIEESYPDFSISMLCNKQISVNTS